MTTIGPKEKWKRNARVIPPLPTLENIHNLIRTFDIRLLMHLSIVAIVASTALWGGRLSLSHSAVPTDQVAEPVSAGLQRPAAISSMPDHYEPPLPIGQPTAEVAAPPQFAAAPPLGDAEEGGMAARAMTSSRGGTRLADRLPARESAVTPVPSPTPAPKKEPLKPQTYKVVEGDTLLGIAYRYGITPETILWANDLGNGDLLQVGDELTILPVSGVLHTVKNGDTLSGIAGAYGADPAKIVETNQMDDANALQEGQTLIIPGGMMRTTEPITGLPSAPSQAELTAAPKYVVKDGDTLLSIADAFGVRASMIQVANGLQDPDKLRLGQELAIPGGRQPSGASRPEPNPPTAQPLKAAPTPAPAKPTPAPQPATPAEVPAPAAPGPEPQTAAPSGSGGERVAALAQKYLGYRYLWGGHSPSTGFDCSGFTWYVYKEVGINIPLHDLAGQLNSGPRISRDKLQPGDLVFFQNTYKPGLSHSGIYLGDGRFINAESESVGVQIRSLSDPYWSPRFIGGSRPW